MSDIKEKYEKVCNIKDLALCLVESQLTGNVENVDAKELGEVMDIAKDAAELIKYCTEAEYYYKVVEAMDDSSSEEKSYYLNKYMPEYGGKFYNPIKYDKMPIWDDEPFRTRMYYTNPTRGLTNRDVREGRSGITRMTYMDMRDSDKNTKMSKFKEYIDDIQKDMEEMFIEGKSTPEEKAYAKQALAQFISKM